MTVVRTKAAHHNRAAFLNALVYLIAAIGVISVVCLVLTPKRFLPAEDAVILFQFSQNLAHTGSITYIPNGPHAEGATDFAWMLLLSAGIRLGLDPFWLVELINVLCLASLGALVCRMANRKLAYLPVLFVMGCFSMMPQIFAAAAGFSVLPFACLLLLLTLSFLRQRDVATPLVALLLCLFRPDGVVFAIPLLISALILFPNRVSRFLLDVLLFVIPGCAYFVWRWHYFGQLLPLPFLVKANAVRFLHLVVVSSVYDGLALLLFCLTLFGIVFRIAKRSSINQSLFFCFVLLASIFYFHMRLDQDLGRRFFIYLPVAVAAIVAINWERVRVRKIRVLSLGLIAWAILVLPPWLAEAKVFLGDQFQSRKEIALDLSRIPHGTMLTTEAGIVPFYSQWTSVDPWGLNTVTFAKRFFQPSDVRDINPDLILLHAQAPHFCRPDAGSTPYSERTWPHLVRNISDGADPARYELWTLPYGNWRLFRSKNESHDVECWLVLRDSSMHADIDGILVRHGAVEEGR